MFTQDQIEAISRRSAVYKYNSAVNLESDFIVFNDLIRVKLDTILTFKELLTEIIERNKDTEKYNINKILVYSKKNVEQGLFNVYADVVFENDVDKFFTEFSFPLDNVAIENYIISSNFAAVII